MDHWLGTAAVRYYATEVFVFLRGNECGCPHHAIGELNETARIGGVGRPVLDAAIQADAVSFIVRPSDL